MLAESSTVEMTYVENIQWVWISNRRDLPPTRDRASLEKTGFMAISDHSHLS
jgi:hypothetical protein